MATTPGFPSDARAGLYREKGDGVAESLGMEKRAIVPNPPGAGLQA